MRIVLIYPPPWKIPRPNDSPFPAGEGPPVDQDPRDVLCGDFLQAPYGLLSIAAQALQAGHRVDTLNLSNAAWSRATRALGQRPAALYGLSCITANRRGTAMLAEWIRKTFPAAHIVVGGPHVSALPRETLVHYGAIDTVVIGEGERTFMEIVGRLASGTRPAGIPGTAWRDGDRICLANPSRPIEDLDRLASPLEYFDLRTLVTSRGCPGNCTFCGSRLMWGRRVRFHSAKRVLAMLSDAVERHGRQLVSFKDDTFTARRERVLRICRGIRQRRLNLEWSCEARTDHLDEELLQAMRMAGCRRISIGVESAAEEILKNIRKQISPTTVLKVTREAKKYGFQVRFYMMVGNRGETCETFLSSLDFLHRAKPNQFVFSQLHLYPGTTEFEIFHRRGAFPADIYFTSNRLNLTCFGGTREAAEKIGPLLKSHQGVRDLWAYDVDACEEVLKRLPGLPSVHMDLCGAYLRAGRLNRAESHMNRALEKGYFLPGMAYNARACIAAGRNHIGETEDCLAKAVECYPHQVAIDNLGRLAVWQESAGADRDRGPALDPGCGFETAYPWNPPESPDPALAGEY